ncbi:FAD-dependent oxidoreductase [Citricoccus sp. GCM10030269]|uniref:FAD-dependent oxidoreductase n=1 Tax=Citricoccus sp. GCM10030269 TaxID=3273388 RepID=UPI003622F4E2
MAYRVLPFSTFLIQDNLLRPVVVNMIPLYISFRTRSWIVVREGAGDIRGRQILRVFTVSVIALFGLTGCSGGEGGVDVPSGSAQPPTSTVGSDFDVIVFGGSPSGVAAAVTAAEWGQKHGHRVALISQYPTVGGAISNGLGAADIGAKSAVTGYADRFFQQIRDTYDDPGAWNVTPSDAENIFRGHLREAGVEIFTDETLESVARTGEQIDCMTTTRAEYCGPVFVDATYTGELAAAADVPFRLGYDDWFDYDEPRSDRVWKVLSALRPEDVPGAEAAFEENPYVTTGVRPSESWSEDAGEGGVSMTYRLCVTKDDDNKIPFAKTENYEKYADGWRRWLGGLSWGAKLADHGSIVGAIQIAPTHDGKWDFNNGHGFANVPAPDGLFNGEREAVFEQMEDYQRNWMWFVQHETPESLRESMAGFGLCSDEFAENDNWPYEPYIREGRRIVGEQTLTMHNIDDPTQRVADESIAIGAYDIDNKPSEYRYWDGVMYRDSASYADVPWYEIPRGVIHPVNLNNLMVTVNVSATSRAHGSLRMEPQYMAMGEAAGAIAFSALLNGTTPADVDWQSADYALRMNGNVRKLSRLCEGMAEDRHRMAAGLDPVTCEPTARQDTDRS